MSFRLTRNDCVGLVRPSVDAHTLGLSAVQQLLDECGFRTVVADAAACEAFGRPEDAAAWTAITRWLAENRVTVLGFSYRLDSDEGAATFGRLIHLLKTRRLLAGQGSPLRAVFFAGLPRTCELVRRQIPEVTGVFSGDETPADTLRAFGIDPGIVPGDLARGVAYDEARLAFGRDLIAKARYRDIRPPARPGYDGFGTDRDTVTARLLAAAETKTLPLMRAHVGPYLPNREDAVRLFLDWARQLAASGFLDILSVGTSQLTQSDFGMDWGNRPNGGGVPLNSREEFAAVWSAARPMLVRAYAGTRNIPDLARMYEETLHIAWHALSFWWFCQIDGRGPYPVRENLRQHIETIKVIAATGKPLEPNVPHHFAFRGADDVTYVVSAYLAARTAKRLGIRQLILQNMLNTPKGTWGVQDLAKSRAMLHLLRGLQDGGFRVILQPRAGLDYFSGDLEKARAQLAAVTALMDDIEPRDPDSPPIIHVVSYSEGSHLADPPVVDESIRITRHALTEYRRLRAAGAVDDMDHHPEVIGRTQELLAEARALIEGIERIIPDAYGAEGLYQVLAAGFLPVPYLWECREEFDRAVRWKTRLVRGSVKVVDDRGVPVSVADRYAVLR
jgi:hypothetical protein